MIALSNLEKTADINKVKEYFSVSSDMRAKALLHDAFYSYIKEQKADAEE